MKKQMAYLLIIAGLILLASGIFLLTKKAEQIIITDQTQKVISETSSTISSTSQKELNTAPPNSDSLKPIDTESNQKQMAEKDNTMNPENVSDQAIENKKKGNAFEQYVVKRFDRKFFRIKEWRSDKYIDGIYADSNRYPDLEISFNWKGQQDLFAVECKWRKDFFKGELEWAEKYQLDLYQKFAKTRKLPVFIIIGIGGLPADPKYIYVIPLEDIKSHILKNAEIKQYLKTDNFGFYWNAGNKSIT